MAVGIDRFDGTIDVRYVGCVLSTYERNGYYDSDFYADCWDEERQEVVTVEYASTRGYCGNSYASVDYTVENLRKAYRFYWHEARHFFDETENIAQAKAVRKGDTVKVVRGRKVPIGTVGKVFWVGTRYNQYSRTDEKRVGIEVGDEKFFLMLDYVEVEDWKSRLLHGKERKAKIRSASLRRLKHTSAALMPIGILLKNSVNRVRGY